MEREKYQQIASSNQGFPILGQFLGKVDQQGVFDPAKEFLKDKAMNLINKNSAIDSNETTFNNQSEDSNAGFIERGQNIYNRIQNLPLDLSTSGVGYTKRVGNENRYGEISVKKPFNDDIEARFDFGVKF
tara:strand:+ start:1097 stop:1486 length:390 start_codon:yes stop_codon:yes gene_type:complete